MAEQKPLTWIITGASAGLGLALSTEVLSHGGRVIAAMRTPSKAPSSLLNNPNVVTIPFDAHYTPSQTSAFMEKAVAAFGQVDVLVNNAGYAYLGLLEEISDEETKRQFEVNVFGMLRLIRAALPYLRTASQSHRANLTTPPTTILNLSSMAGFWAVPPGGIYSASKFAIEGFSQSLAIEVADFDIRVAVVNPGMVRTGFLASHASGTNMPPAFIKAYDSTSMRQVVERIKESNWKQAGDPEKAAARMYEFVMGTGMWKEKLREKKGELGKLLIGSDCGEALKNQIEWLKRVVEGHEDVWRSTDIVE
ncbi:MAG: putative secondary metabolism biosynthetic enzyme [Cirrosporium novae-zelandiae]|nr:MAG: putative secondary metabolism biosynthetic enzyme [Cirrosporium novae-zelandiae]